MSSKRRATTAIEGKVKALRCDNADNADLIEIEYDDEWYVGHVVREVEAGVKVGFHIDGSTVVIPQSQVATRIRTPTAAAAQKHREEQLAAAAATANKKGGSGSSSTSSTSTSISSKSSSPTSAASASDDDDDDDDDDEAEEYADGEVPRLSRVYTDRGVIDVSNFAFFVISKGRADNVEDMEDLFDGSGVRPTWVVGAGEVEAYEAALAEYDDGKGGKGGGKGANAVVVEGGKLTPSRNRAVELAKAAGKRFCVQLSDDLRHITAFDHKDDGKWGALKGAGKGAGKKAAAGGEKAAEKGFGWKKPRTQQEANLRSQKAAQYALSPVGAARLIESGMRESGAKYGGVFPCMNSGFAYKNEPFTTRHFIVGDFIVLDTESPLRFDEEFRLKEDYDLTAQHLDK